MIDQFINKVFNGNALDLLRRIPSESIHSVIPDPMYMVAKKKGKSSTYEWGSEPGQGNADEFWRYHEDIYQECRRVLRPGGTLAWAMGCKFVPHFPTWFGGYRIWGFSRYFTQSVNAFGHIWMVQTKEQAPIPFPNEDALLIIEPQGWWRKLHPCPKSEEEMRFMVRHLSQSGQIVLDCFAGSGSTLVAAEQLGRPWIGCDLSKTYCQIAMKRLAELRQLNNQRRHA